MALVVLLIVSAAMAILAAAIQFDNADVRNLERELQVNALRDLALAETVAKIAETPGYSGYGGLRRRVVKGGWLESEVIQLSSKTLIVEVRVSFGGLRRGASARVRLREKLPPTVSGWQALRVR